MSGSIFNKTTTPSLRQIPLSLDNNLPFTVIIFGTPDDNEVAFSCHLDSCVTMDTGSYLLHMWIMTTYLDIVASYKRYGDNEPL